MRPISAVIAKVTGEVRGDPFGFLLGHKGDAAVTLLVLGEIQVDVGEVGAEPGEMARILCLELLHAQDIRLLLLHETSKDVVGGPALFLAVFELAGHGLDTVDVEGDNAHG